ncbi:hypothetical protein ACVWZ4_001792 [Bradyrhizobium sp. USDA 4472]
MTTSSAAEERAVSTLRELHAAEDELIGKTVVMTDGKGRLIISISTKCTDFAFQSLGHDGEWPISTVKRIQN